VSSQSLSLASLGGQAVGFCHRRGDGSLKSVAVKMSAEQLDSAT
jgi:hypothetical protein